MAFINISFLPMMSTVYWGTDPWPTLPKLHARTRITGLAPAAVGGSGPDTRQKTQLFAKKAEFFGEF
jgi:hypothetical protein